jgi:hypothetical protein
MRPEERYLVRRDAYGRHWRIVDARTLATMVTDIATQRGAREIRNALIDAWHAGVLAVKNGEIVV